MVAIIFAGGKNYRMGKNKAFLKFGTQTFLQHIINSLKPFFLKIYLVTNSPELYAHDDIIVITDEVPGGGPLGGIYSGLRASDDEHNFVMGCDMPFVNPGLVRYLNQLFNGYDLVIPRIDGHYETLSTIYGKGCLPFIGQQLREKNLKIIDFFDKIKKREVLKQEVVPFDASLRCFLNINTAADYQTYIKGK